MEKVDQADPIWGQPSDTYRITADAYQFSNDRSGRFSTDVEGFQSYIIGWPAADRAKIATWILNQNRAGIPATLNVAAMKQIENQKRLSIGEKIDRFFLMLEESGYRPGDILPWVPGLATATSISQQHKTMLWIEAASDGEFFAFRDILADAGLIVVSDSKHTRLGPAGLERLEKVNQGTSDTKQAFVAMWFSPTMEGIFGGYRTSAP